MIETSITKWIKKKIRRLIGIVEDGDTATHSIASGKYVVWKGDLYKASTAIAIGTTLSTSNLTAVSDGGLNEINGNLAKYMTNPETTTAVIQTVSPTTWTEYTIAESGWYKLIAIRDSATNNVDVRLPTGSVPTGEPLMSAADGGGNRFVLYAPLKAGTKIRILCSNTNCKFSAVRY